MYTNPDGITGKIASLTTAIQSANPHIVGLAETKLGPIAPVTQGYTWINKNRKGKGGGVALMIRDDIKNKIKQVHDLEDQDQEVAWIELPKQPKKTFIGIYYGQQEKCSNEEAQRQFSQLTSQVSKLKQSGEVILMGDFNAKIAINDNKTGATQQQSRNGKLMQEMIDDTNLDTVSTKAHIGIWTRVNRKKTTEKSIIDYVLMTKETAKATNYMEIDEAGIYRLKGKEETDHNTILFEVGAHIAGKETKEKIYNLKNKESWREYNKKMQEKYYNKPPRNYTQFERMVSNTLEETMEKITITRGKYKPKLTDKAKQLKMKRK